MPGPSSVTTALSVAGAMGDGGAFVFAGFLPAKAGEREAAIGRLAQETRTVVLLEAPHRIEPLARSLAQLGQRPVTVCRELTKQFEEIATLACAELPAWLAADAQRTRGEFALVLHAAPQARKGDDGLRVLALLLQELPVKTAVKLAAEITGGSRNELYQSALALKAEAGGRRPALNGCGARKAGRGIHRRGSAPGARTVRGAARPPAASSRAG